MKWRTGISTEAAGERVIFGEELSGLMANKSFSEVSFLLLAGRLPTAAQLALFDTILVAVCEHGVAAPSAYVGRVVASTGNPMNAALAASVLSVGDFHGGAIEDCARLLADVGTPANMVEAALAKHTRLAGFGHKIYKNGDPRAKQILARVLELGFGGPFAQRAQAIEDQIEQQKGRKLPLNVDGAMAVAMLELELEPALGKALFILGRLPGMIANIREEQVNEQPYRRLDAEDIEFTGARNEA